VAVSLVGAHGYRAHRAGGGALPHDGDSAEDRQRFVGFATLLLSGLSALGIVYSALPALFIESCL
jgi:hypothetical protein